MAKEVAGLIKLQIKGGAANPSPPVGPALGSKGINIMGFCKEFNARTQDKAGNQFHGRLHRKTVQVLHLVLGDSPHLLKEAAKVKSGSSQPNRQKVASVTWEQVRAIAEDKMKDLNCFTVESAMKLIAGTARSMGITVKGDFPGE